MNLREHICVCKSMYFKKLYASELRIYTQIYNSLIYRIKTQYAYLLLSTTYCLVWGNRRVMHKSCTKKLKNNSSLFFHAKFRFVPFSSETRNRIHLCGAYRYANISLHSQNTVTRQEPPTLMPNIVRCWCFLPVC